MRWINIEEYYVSCYWDWTKTTGPAINQLMRFVVRLLLRGIIGEGTYMSTCLEHGRAAQQVRYFAMSFEPARCLWNDDSISDIIPSIEFYYSTLAHLEMVQFSKENLTLTA